MDDSRAPRPRDVAELIGPLLAHVGEGFGRVVVAWERAVGPELARRATPVRLRDSQLHVRCSSGAWASELMHRQQEIIPRLDRQLGRGMVTSIVARAGRVALEPPSAAPVPAPPLPPPPPALRSYVDSLVSSLPAGSLRSSVAAAMIAAEQRREVGEEPGY